MTHIKQVGSRLVLVAAVAGACARPESHKAGAEADTMDSAAVASAAGSAVRRVSNVMIGRQVGSSNRITEPTFEFAPKDTVHLSVGIEGTDGDGTLTAAWRSQTGVVLQQTSEQARPAGENTVFHLSQPKGFKPGTYKVIVFLGGDSVETKVFVVKK